MGASTSGKNDGEKGEKGKRGKGEKGKRGKGEKADGDHSGLSQPAMAHRGDCLKCRLCLVWCVGRTLHGYLVRMAHPTWRALPALLYCKTAGMICISDLSGVGPRKKVRFC